MSTAPDPVKLRIAGVGEHFNLPWQLGLERRAFFRAGVELRWRTVKEGTGAMCDLLHKGEVDLAVLVTEGAVMDILNGNPRRIVSAFVDSPLTWGLHVGAGSPRTSLEELKGDPFVISRYGSGSHLAALAFAQQQGWTPTEDQFIVANDLDGAIQALQGAEPATFLWERYTTKPFVDQGLLRCVGTYRNSWPAFVLVAREDVLAGQGQEVQRLVKIVRDQAAGLMQKKSAPEMIAHRYGLTVPDAREWFAEVRWNTDGNLDPEVFFEVAGSLRSADLLNEVPEQESITSRLIG